ncbi:SdpA family antimicrobial peptide system protein [Salinithrix halophila]|uniref:SdpA family antimicrobial peptide system protein n=1 Tax=Salinithrix halophila TaxID=1485204 RepID=A0ABV8JF61_9BACL
MGSLRNNAYGRFSVIFFLASSFWIILITLSILSAMPSNALRPALFKVEEKLNINSWYPQGWGFYSKNPKEDQFLVYNVSKKEFAAVWPNMRAENLWGLKRFGRSQGIESGFIHSKIPPSLFKKCDKDPLVCLAKSRTAFEVENPIPFPTICGDIGFASQPPVPWAWSKSKKKVVMPSKVVRVKITCSE